MQNEALLKEYQELRREILERVKILHALITMGVILSFISLLFYFLILSFGAPASTITLYLLFLPLVFGGLTFNYQANQMTLEAVATYLNRGLKPQIDQMANRPALEWENYYTRHKFTYQLISFLKVLPLLLPMLLPVILIIQQGGLPTETLPLWLSLLDLAFLLLIAFNFRYKISKA